MIAARPTTYNGIKMRSRLEARYAAQLDDEERSWTYEPQAFANQSGQYLPDFAVDPEADDPLQVMSYVEVRPTIEGAYRVMARMPIIWDSVPDAVLIIVVPDLDLYWWASQSIRDARWNIYRNIEVAG